MCYQKPDISLATNSYVHRAQPPLRENSAQDDNLLSEPRPLFAVEHLRPYTDTSLPFRIPLCQLKVMPLLQLRPQITEFRVAAELLLMTHGRRRAPYGAL